MLRKYSEEFGIAVNEDAKEEIIDKSSGISIYIRMLLEDADRRGFQNITKEFVQECPTGLLEYVSKRILDRIFFLEGTKPKKNIFSCSSFEMPR